MTLDPATHRHFVYAIYDNRNDDLVYVGSGMKARLRSTLKNSHIDWIRANKKFLRLEHSEPMSRQRSRVVEAFVIRLHKPRLNSKLDKPRGLYDFCCLQAYIGNCGVRWMEPSTIFRNMSPGDTWELSTDLAEYDQDTPERLRVYAFESPQERLVRLRRQLFTETNLDAIDVELLSPKFYNKEQT